MARHRGDWSELYQELLISIAGRLDTRDDVRHLRAVCKKWRLAISQIPPNLPLLSPLFPHKISPNSPAYSTSEDFFYERPSGNPFFIVANTTFLIRPHESLNPNPFKPWLITVEELNPGKFLLRKPLTRFLIENLPENFPRVLDLSDYSVREISKAYNFRYPEDSVNMKWASNWRKLNNKVVLFFNPASASHTLEDCYCLVLREYGQLLCARLHDKRNHKYLSHSRVCCFDDIVIYNGRVWAIDRKARVYVIHYSNALRLVMFSKDPLYTGYAGDTRNRLVESSDGLYLISRHFGTHGGLIGFRVYKLNEGECKWNVVKSLDGRILFVSTDCCFFMPTEFFPKCGGNCIFFPKGHFPTYHNGIHPEDKYFKQASWELEIGVFHLDNEESALVSAYPGYSDVFWPPPKWLFQDPCSSTCVGEEDEENDLEACCSEGMCTSSLAVEARSQVAENPCRLEVQDEFVAVYAPWSEIPSKLLSEIAKHLKTRIDISRFRAVCKKWRTSIPPPPTSNILCPILPHKISTTTAPFVNTSRYSTSNCSLTLVASTTYLLQPRDQSLVPSKSWLVRVEELKPGKLSLQLPLRRDSMRDLPENFPSVLDLSDFNVSEVGIEYYFRDPKSGWLISYFHASSFAHVNKVVLFSNNSACTSPTIDDTTAMVLCNSGTLVSFRLRDEYWSTVNYGALTKFDDIVNCKGKIYAIDRKGRAYVISCNTSGILRIVDDAIGTGAGSDRRKRLVESCGELYLLVRHSPDEKIYYRVYKLNEEQHKWDEVGSLGDRILFLTPSFGFMASARHFPRWKGNCIVFPAYCLPTFCGCTYADRTFFKGTIKELEIGVFRLGNNGPARLIKFYSGYSDLFWPPPAWLQPLACLSRNPKVQIDFPGKHSQEEGTSAQEMELAAEGQIVENSSISASQDIAPQKLPEQDLASTITSPVEASSSGSSTVSFVREDIRSELVPILQKIWANYGNVAEGCMVHSSGLVAKALESLAEAVFILKSTTGRSLEQSQAEILRTTLSDLQFMQFRVGWLVPYIEKALACQKSKPLLNDLSFLESVKARLQEMKRKQVETLAEIENKPDEGLEGDLRERMRNLVDLKRELGEVEGKVDEETRKVIDGINALGPIDLEKCLGEGLC